jgi:hypothetical protein
MKESACTRTNARRKFRAAIEGYRERVKRLDP